MKLYAQDVRAMTNDELLGAIKRLNAYALAEGIRDPRQLNRGGYLMYCAIKVEMQHRGVQLRLDVG